MKFGKLFDATDASVPVTSIEFDLVDRVNYGVEIQLSGSSLTGTMVLLSSITGEVFIPIEESSLVLESGDDLMYSVSNGNYRYVKMKWVPTSGTGTLKATYMIKQQPDKGL